MSLLQTTFLDQRETTRSQAWVWLGILLAIHLGLRLWLCFSPILAQADYDEAIVGLMATHVSRGDPQLFYWGHPWIGAADSYLAGLVFSLFGPSTLAYRLVTVFLSSLILLAIHGMGRMAGGRKAGLAAAAFWALPPIFTSFGALYFGGGYLSSLLAAAFCLYGAAKLAWEPPDHPLLLALAMGVATGLGWWSTLLAMPLALAALLGLFLARPRLLKSWLPLVLLAGFAAGSAPWWWWNLGHDFASLSFMQTHQDNPSLIHTLLAAWQSLLAVWRDSLLPSLAGAWWDGSFAPPSMPLWARNSLAFLIYLPVLGLGLYILYEWARRPLEKRFPWQGAEDLVVWGLLAFLAAQTLGGLGRSLPIRHALAAHLPLAVLVGLTASRLGSRWPAPAWGWLVLILAFNLASNLGFMGQTAKLPSQDVSQVAQRLKHLGLSACLAHNRVGQPVTFASGEKVTCADWLGRRNFSYLDLVKKSPRPVFLTHRSLAQPKPEELAAAFRLLGARARQESLGPYEFWWDFQAPSPAGRSLPSEAWRLSASGGSAPNAADRDIWTACTLPTTKGAWLQLDLGAVRGLTRVTVLPAPMAMPDMAALPNPGAAGAPAGLTVLLSADGKNWFTAAREKTFAAGLHWGKHSPLPSRLGLVQVDLHGRPARYLRLVQLSPPANGPWRVGEVFVYENAPAAPPAPAASRALAAAQGELSHFEDVPTGVDPWGPLGPGLRRRGVDFTFVQKRLAEAMRNAPDWEEPFIRYAEASALAGRPQVAPVGNLTLVTPRAPALLRHRPGAPGGDLALSLSGSGPFRVRWSEGSNSGRLVMGEPQVALLPGANGPVLVTAGEKGEFLARLAAGPCQTGAALSAAGRYGEALTRLSNCLIDQKPSPPLLLELAWTNFKAGKVRDSANMASRLAASFPQLYSRIISDLAAAGQGPHGPDWRKLAWPEERFGVPATYVEQAEESRAPLGRMVDDPLAGQGRAIALVPGQTPAGAFHLWFPQVFHRGRYLVNFRLKGIGQEITLAVLRHHADRVWDRPLEKHLWIRTSDKFRDVALALDNRLEPVRLEVRLAWNGQQPLYIDQVSIVADPGGGLVPKMEVMESLPAGGRRPAN